MAARRYAMKALASAVGTSLLLGGAAAVAVWAACSQSDSNDPSTSGGGASVLQFHKNASRDGLYVDAAFTKASAAGIHMDPSFKATIKGPTFAQPLYFE